MDSIIILPFNGQFGGSGRALGGTAAATSGGGGWLGGGGGDTSSGSASTSKEREAVAARRLAALSHQRGATQSSLGGVGSDESSTQGDLQRLQVSQIKRQAMADAASNRMWKIGNSDAVASRPAAVLVTPPNSSSADTSLLSAATSNANYSTG